MGRVKWCGKGRKEREEKITFAQSKHITLQSIIYSPEKPKTYWSKQHFATSSPGRFSQASEVGRPTFKAREKRPEDEVEHFGVR